MDAAYGRAGWGSVAALCLLVLHASRAGAQVESRIASDAVARITALSVNGDPVGPVADGGIRLPARRQADLFVSFDPFGPGKAGPAGTRLLYKLEPADSDWRDIDRQMRLSVICFGPGPEYRQTGMFEFYMFGKSTGWRGTLAASACSRGSGMFTVPAETRSIGAALWSGGAFSTVGVLAVDGLTVRRVGSRPGEGDVLGTFPCDDTMSAWEKFGSDTDSATIGRLDGRPMLAFDDGDAEHFSGWRLRPEAHVAVSPGAALEVSWNEVFSIGGNGPHEVRYRGLQPGTYRFRLAAATTEGVPTGVERSIDLVLPEALVGQPWFLAACGCAAAAAALGVWRYVAWNRLQIRLAHLEKAHAVSTERTRIAQDLHDELGGSLTQIALVSELTKDRLTDADSARSQLDTIFSTARHLARQLDAVVWATSPAQDTVESLANFVSKEAQAYLRPAGIGCRLLVPDELPPCPLSALERRSIFLVVKEALHNVVQHAHAAEVRIRMTADHDVLAIDVEDDGRGIAADAATRTVPAGHDGLANMRSRMAAIGGTCQMAPGPGGRGTVVRIRLPITVENPSLERR